jgi:hypothetical protein
MKSFLIVYDTRSGTLLDMRVFDAGRDDEALQERFREEIAKNANEDVEIVVLRAASEDAIRQSHARYFASSSELLTSAGASLRAG